MPTYRVEATVPVVQWVEAKNAKEAIATAVANGGDWEIDADAEITDEDVTHAGVADGEEG